MMPRVPVPPDLDVGLVTSATLISCVHTKRGDIVPLFIVMKSDISLKDKPEGLAWVNGT